ncbi:LysR family transcriptional regulator [Nesterenkonia muleiensis]|uniref:LysR family transcriptional regulator n=1 Tax=Nesterenkonia muleiensis TaxID=2282648 RepID=UPI000E754746|nr:LysR family transcriptional regulator [Nesterenkonia muleiensis]
MAIQSDVLRYFKEVVDAGSIQTASRNLLIAPSALSRQIKILEKELGVTLFERSSQGMVSTSAGMTLYDFARRQEAEADELKHILAAGVESESAEFSIACVEAMLPRLLPQWLGPLRRRHPQVRFLVDLMSSTQVAATVASGDADAGFTFGRVARAELRELAALHTPIQLVVRRDHPLADRKTVSLIELQGERCALPRNQFGIRREVDRECARAGVELEIAYETNSLAFALRMVQTEGVVTFTTSALLVQAEHAQSVSLIELEEDAFKSTAFSLVVRKTPSSALSDSLKRELSRLCKASERVPDHKL